MQRHAVLFVTQDAAWNDEKRFAWDNSQNPRKECTSASSGLDSLIYGLDAYSPLVFDIEHEFIYIAPSPVFARFYRTRDGMLRRMEVLARMSVLGAVAAPHVAAV